MNWVLLVVLAILLGYMIAGYAKGFLIVVIARKTADWIMGNEKND